MESFAFKPESPQENLLYRPSPYFFLLSQIQRPIQWKGRLLTFWPPLVADGCCFPSEIIGAWDLQGERKCAPEKCGSGTLLRRFLQPPFLCCGNEVMQKVRVVITEQVYLSFPTGLKSLRKECWCHLTAPIFQHNK